MNSLEPKTSNLEPRSGFTLVETLIYAAVLAVLTGSVIATFYQIVGSQTQGRVRNEVQTEANFLMGKVEWALAGAAAINVPVAGATSTTLSVNKYNFATNPLVFSLVSGTFQLARGTGSPVVLNSSDVKVQGFVAQHVSSAGGLPDAVNITLSVAASSSEWATAVSTTLQNTVYLKK